MTGVGFGREPGCLALTCDEKLFVSNSLLQMVQRRVQSSDTSSENARAELAEQSIDYRELFISQAPLSVYVQNEKKLVEFREG